MVLTADQQRELLLFQQEIELQNPEDTLQFAANYFNRRLEQQRASIKSQESLLLAKGIILFPDLNKGVDDVKRKVNIPPIKLSVDGDTHGDSSTSNNDDGSNNTSKGDERDVQFRSPFIEQGLQAGVQCMEEDTEMVNVDPHSSLGVAPVDPVSVTPSASAPSGGAGSGAGSGASELFRGNFNLAESNTSRDIQSSINPMSSTPVGGISSNNLHPHRSPGSGVQKLPMNFNAQRRTSVSAETFQPDCFDNWTPVHRSEKTSEQLKGLQNAVGKTFLFNKLDSESKLLVLNSLLEKYVQKGEEIIKQGDEGDYFYIVERGTVEFQLDGKKVNTSGPGSSFGELALMYNSPRAATVVAATDCVLWALDRLTFRKILLGGSFKKRVLHDDFLRSMPLFKSLSNYDRAKLADALDTEYYEPGDKIICEGDVGENFYLVESGEAEVSKADQGVIAVLKKGDYFGEVALLNDLPRQATVTATKKTKVVTLGKSGFQRLLGPAVEVLKLNDPTRTDK